MAMRVSALTAVPVSTKWDVARSAAAELRARGAAPAREISRRLAAEPAQAKATIEPSEATLLPHAFRAPSGGESGELSRSRVRRPSGLQALAAARYRSVSGGHQPLVGSRVSSKA